MLRMKWTPYDTQLHAIRSALLDLSMALSEDELARCASDLLDMHAALNRVRDVVPEKKGEKL